MDLLGYLSSFVSDSFALKTQTFKGNIYIWIKTNMECVVYTSQLKIFLSYIWAGKKAYVNFKFLFGLHNQTSIHAIWKDGV